jgi:hypothetical protein
MNVEAILKDLREERDSLEQAILSLERLGAGQGKRRGRPPAWMKRIEEAQAVEAPKRRGRPAGSKSKPKAAAGE